MKYFEVETYYQMSRKAANLISAQIISKPDSVIGLATGSTPLGIYRQLIEWYKKGDIDFSEVTAFNLDEYVGISFDDPQSYHYYMKHNFFDHININPNNTYIPNANAEDANAAGKAFDDHIKELGGIDVQLLGIGNDGHIGFNEPDEYFTKSTHLVKLHESTINANSRFFDNIDDVPKFALTMGMISIMQAKKIILVACGEDKKEILDKAFNGPITPLIPASILQLHSDITVIYSHGKE